MPRETQSDGSFIQRDANNNYLRTVYPVHLSRREADNRDRFEVHHNQNKLLDKMLGLLEELGGVVRSLKRCRRTLQVFERWEADIHDLQREVNNVIHP